MRTPLDKNDHAELNDTELLIGESIQHYHTMIGQLQWLVTLGGLTSMHKPPPCPDSGLPNQRHLERLQRVYGLTEFRQPLQVQSHLEMPGILVQLGHIQRT